EAALPQLPAALATSSTIANLSTALPTIGSAICPMYWSYLSEHKGRRIPYLAALAIFVALSIVAAIANSIVQLVILRMLSGMVGCAVTATGAAVVGDLWDSKELGRAMSVYYIGVLMGPTLGPVIGGFLVQRWGWRAAQWFLVIYGALTFIVTLIVLPETLIIQKLDVAEDVNPALQHGLDQTRSIGGILQNIKGGYYKVHHILFRPLRITRCLQSPIVLLTTYLASITLLFYRAIEISIQKAFSTSPYNFDPLRIGLCFLPAALGLLGGDLISGMWSDHVMNKVARKNGESPDTQISAQQPEHRIRENAWCGMLLLAGSLVWYGWTVRFGAIWEVPLHWQVWPFPGLLIFRASSSVHIAHDKFIEYVLPAVEDANRGAEGFSQISKDAIVIMQADVDYPTTDKASIQRAKVYQVFADVIVAVHMQGRECSRDGLKLSVAELERWLLETLRSKLQIRIDDATADYYRASMESLRALQLRNMIVQDLDLNGCGKSLGPLAVFECGNTYNLARALLNLQAGYSHNPTNPFQQMSSQIQEHSSFPAHKAEAYNILRGYTVLLTGVSGFLGSQILFNLLASPQVVEIWCHVRASDSQNAFFRLEAIMKAKFAASAQDLSKVVAFTGDLSHEPFGLTIEQYTHVKSHLTHIIHAAYPVNLVLPLSHFLSQITTTHVLLSFSLSTSTPRDAGLSFDTLACRQWLDHMLHGRGQELDISASLLEYWEMQEKLREEGDSAQEDFDGSHLLRREALFDMRRTLHDSIVLQDMREILVSEYIPKFFLEGKKVEL
ncbi:hypothetical protein DSL72_000250, partial [Monilinia vaccinii-corymbosi]